MPLCCSRRSGKRRGLIPGHGGGATGRGPAATEDERIRRAAVGPDFARQRGGGDVSGGPRRRAAPADHSADRGGRRSLGVEAMRQGIQDYLVKGRADGRQIGRSIRYAIERKRNEEALRRMEERLRQIQKLESLGVLAGGIAHDFNNLLTVTLGHSELALAEVPADSPAHLHLRRIFGATQRAAALSRQMLAYSGKQPLALETLSLSDLVKKAGRMLEVSISRKARLSCRLAEGLPLVMGDATQLSQAMMNLVLNASQAIGENEGTITLVTRTLQCDRAFLDAVQMDRFLPEGLYVCLEVSDTGCGMDAQTMAKAFDPFFTTKFVGRGLGLAVVQGIVRGHKGRLWWRANQARVRPSASSCRRPRRRPAGKACSSGPPTCRRRRHGVARRRRGNGAGVGTCCSSIAWASPHPGGCRRAGSSGSSSRRIGRRLCARCSIWSCR